MVGVKMGERLVWVGAGTPAMFVALARKVGLTGHAAAIVTSEEDADRVRDAAAREGVLTDVHVQPHPRFVVDDRSFDVAIVDSTAGSLASIRPEARVDLFREVRRTLRPGGRAIAIERTPRGGLGALVSQWTIPSLGAKTLAEALRSEGFRPVRVLAERDGYVFVEGMNT